MMISEIVRWNGVVLPILFVDIIWMGVPVGIELECKVCLIREEVSAEDAFVFISCPSLSVIYSSLHTLSCNIILILLDHCWIWLEVWISVMSVRLYLSWVNCEPSKCISPKYTSKNRVPTEGLTSNSWWLDADKSINHSSVDSSSWNTKLSSFHSTTDKYS